MLLRPILIKQLKFYKINRPQKEKKKTKVAIKLWYTLQQCKSSTGNAKTKVDSTKCNNYQGKINL